MTRLQFFSIVLSLFLVIVGDYRHCREARAQAPEQQILEDADRVFTRPEFQKFKKMRPGDRFHDFDLDPGFGGSGNLEGEGNGEAGAERSEETGDDRGPDSRVSGNSSNSSSSSSGNFSLGSFGDFGAGLAELFRLFGIVATVVMVLIILWLVIPALLSQDRMLEGMTAGEMIHHAADEDENSVVPRLSAEQYLQEARRLADEHQYREAVCFVLLASMVVIESKGLIRRRRGLTLHDYYRALRKEERMGPAYRSLVKLYEPLGFGRRTADRDHYQAAIQFYEAGFQR